MGSYRNYKLRIKEDEDTEGYLEILDKIIEVLENKGLIEYDIGGLV